ncbi:hypothetical protein Fmac_020922 [Flemingia macrophylla]|uniref:Uncharacterized protein n=1 Tax=Flemingia macrophylla TaxID=520843 RepID=A0ABD1LVC0_9FABA
MTSKSNLMLLFCLVAVINNNNVVFPCSATRQLKTSPNEKEAMMVTQNIRGRNNDQADTTSMNNNMEKKEQKFDKNQLPPLFPFPQPFPLPPNVPVFPWPIPGAPSIPFPPVAIPAAVPNLSTPPPI